MKTVDEMVAGRMQLTDMNGRVVYSGSLNAAKAALSIPGLATGVYILNINNGIKIASNLLMKQ